MAKSCIEKDGLDINVELNEETRHIFKNELKNYDTDGNGKIDENELGNYLRDIGIYLEDGYVTDLVGLLDTDGTKGLSIDELVDHLDVIETHCIDGEELIECFKVFDIGEERGAGKGKKKVRKGGGNGKLSFDEIRTILTARGKERWTYKEATIFITELLREFDTNKDGFFSYDEFVVAYRQGQFRFRESEKPKIKKEAIDQTYTMEKTPEPPQTA